MRHARALAAILALCLSLAAACGGGGGGQSGDDTVKKVAKAIQQPGMVYHTIGDDGSEVWIDAENETFRREETVTGGGKLISIGDGWVETIYNPIDNTLESQDHTIQGSTRPRIDSPMIFWLDPLSALALGQDLKLIGRTVSDGQEVLALTVQTPLLDEEQQLTGGFLQGRVELDPETYFPAAYERREVAPTGATPGEDEGLTRVVYTTAELVPRDSLDGGFFDSSVVESQLKTIEDTIDGIRALGAEPLWLGPQYESERGKLALPSETTGFELDTGAATATFTYGLVVPVEGREVFADGALIVRLGPVGTEFGPPPLDEFAGDIPEQRGETTARGVPAEFYVSFLSPADLGCPNPDPVCPGGNIPLYTRLLFTTGNTVVQIEANARIDDIGVDHNGYNNLEGLILLAEALQVSE